MNDRYRLGGLEDEALLAGLSRLVKRENDALSDLLTHLAELDERRLCIARGYPSLFAYCCEALGFCKSSAGRRIAAARVCRQYPEAFERVAKGELQLCVLSILGKHLTAENAAELIAACSGKSYEQVEALLAARFPRADVRDLVRPLPARAASAPDIGSRSVAAVSAPDIGGRSAESAGASAFEPLNLADSRIEPVERLVPDRAAAAPSVQAEAAPSARVAVAARGVIKPISEARFSVNFCADSEFKELLDEVRALASHGRDGGNLMSLMKRGLHALRSELLKQRFGVGRKPRRVRLGRVQSAKKPRGRLVPAAVAREVYQRDGGRCSFCSDDGRRCESRELLQIDHIVAHAGGGQSTLGNLRLRCRAHNLYAAEVRFGSEYVRSKVTRSRGGAQRESEQL